MNYLRAPKDPTPAPPLRPMPRVGAVISHFERIKAISAFNPDLAWRFTAQGRRDRVKRQQPAQHHVH